MTSDDSGLRVIATVVAVLLAIPLLMMGVVMPLLVLTGVGHMPFGIGGWKITLSVIPLVVVGSLVYVLFAGIGVEDQETDGELGELRSAYARGELSDTEFQNRRDRLRSQASTVPRSGVPNDECGGIYRRDRNPTQ